MSDKNLLAQLFALNDAAQIREDYVRAPFGYPGGKSRSLKNLLQHLPYRKVWVDAFAGSGAVTLARNESELEIFNDRHAGITAFFRCVADREKCKQLAERLEMTVCSREEFAWCRDTWNACNWLDDVERAARWYYTVQHSFNSKSWAFGRVTGGRSQCAKLHNNIALFWPVHSRLRKAYIENMDYRILIDDINKNKNNEHGSVVYYFDPPYWKTNGIYEHNFTERDHFELADRAMHLHGFVAISGYDHPDHPYNKPEFKWHKKEQWEVDISMAGMAYHETNNLVGMEDLIKRGKALETLWIRDTI